MIYGDYILAAAYRGNPPPEAMLCHAVSDKWIQIGKLKRSGLQALCNKKLNVAGNLSDVSEINCPRCKEILVKAGLAKEIE